MNYCSRVKYDSELKDKEGELLYPGVSFTIQRMNERRRVHREIAIAGLRLKVNEQSAALKKAMEDLDGLAPGEFDRMNAAMGELLHGEWYPAWIRWGLYSIEGLDIDGAKATVDTLCEAGPTDLVEEIFLAVIKAAGLSDPERKNSPSPGASDAPAAGGTSALTASGATPAESGKTATAPSTTQTT